jgi:hypothetical protein
MGIQFIRRAAGLAALFIGGASSLGCVLPEYVEVAGDCEPGQTWVRHLGGPFNDTVKAASSDVCGGVTVGGSFQSYADLGLKELLQAEGHDGVIVRFDATGRILWLVQLGSDGDQFVSSLTTDLFGGAIAAGEFTGTLAPPGGSPVTAPEGQLAAFVTRFDLRGAHHWTRTFREESGASDTNVCGVAVDPSGNVTVAGDFKGTVDFGGMAETGQWENNIFVAHYDPEGQLLWTNSYQTELGAFCNDIAADKDGNILMTGSYKSAIDFGGGEHKGPNAGVDAHRVFVLKLNSAGDRVWSQGTNDVDHQQGIAIATDSVGNVVVAGNFSDKVPLGGTEVVPTAGYSDIFVKKLRPDGAAFWGKTFGGGSDDLVGSVVIGPAGEVVIEGSTLGEIVLKELLVADFDAMMITQTADPIIATLDAFDGEPLAGRIFHGPTNESITGLTLDPQGYPIVIGTFDTTINLGVPDGDLTAKTDPNDVTPTEDIFVVKLSP